MAPQTRARRVSRRSAAARRRPAPPLFPARACLAACAAEGRAGAGAPGTRAAAGAGWRAAVASSESQEARAPCWAQGGAEGVLIGGGSAPHPAARTSHGRPQPRPARPLGSPTAPHSALAPPRDLTRCRCCAPCLAPWLARARALLPRRGGARYCTVCLSKAVRPARTLRTYAPDCAPTASKQANRVTLEAGAGGDGGGRSATLVCCPSLGRQFVSWRRFFFFFTRKIEITREEKRSSLPHLKVLPVGAGWGSGACWSPLPPASSALRGVGGIRGPLIIRVTPKFGTARLPSSSDDALSERWLATPGSGARAPRRQSAKQPHRSPPSLVLDRRSTRLGWLHGAAASRRGAQDAAAARAVQTRGTHARTRARTHARAAEGARHRSFCSQ